MIGGEGVDEVHVRDGEEDVILADGLDLIIGDEIDQIIQA